ncbi:OTU deubiquitinase with linear linkage specificity b isoform X2 [Brienomyrus brachyistius]|uniref:OTU deubiquitinase with linear linkage specificity b isoform X2 n=1 Tax=Brienomyrus brachyistius TaxID=42636 RepID=UPI0020B24ABB|nr:OTU deubiquitinase with linear linkage specificity b isoform X2 [Brienomyrus brachyistius]
MLPPRRRRGNTAFNMGSCFSTDRLDSADDTKPSTTAEERKRQGDVEMQREESGAPEKRRRAALERDVGMVETSADIWDEGDHILPLKNGAVSCTSAVVIEDPYARAEDGAIANQQHHPEHRQIADRPKDQAYPEAGRCPGTFLKSKLLQDKSSFCSESQAGTPCESVPKLADSERIHVAVPGNVDLAADMRQDQRPIPTAKVKTEEKTTVGQSEASEKDRASSPQEGLSGTGKPLLPKEIIPGPHAGKDAARTDKGAAQDNLVRSQAKGPKDSAGQSHPADVNREPMKAEGSIGPTDDDSGEIDLYRGAEEIEEERDRRSRARERLSGEQRDAAPTDQCSVAQEVGLLCYSEREWRGNTAKSTLIRKGYEVVYQRFQGLRRVRGDNYCALRATLFQVLCHHQPPDWLQQRDITQWPLELLEQEDLIKLWRLPLDLKEQGGFGSTTACLKYFLDLLKKKWQQAAQSCSIVERQRTCEQLFWGGKLEYGLLEAVKLLMLCTAVELHGRMHRGDPVPDFSWLLFARDSSSCPRAFLTNHLSLVGFSGGLEQVEMFLLGYTLKSTIQVYRLYKAQTEEFITYYPDDHKDDWQHVCLVTEDDRHYNIPVARLDGANSQEPRGTTCTSPKKLSL